MLTLLHLPSPLWKFLSPNLTEKRKKKEKKRSPFNFDSIKNSFWVHRVSGIKILFPKFHKNLSSGFWKKSSLYFTSPMKISKSKCNSKTPKNPFIFDSIQISFLVYKVTGIRMLFIWFHKKKLSSSFWEKFTLLHLTYENF